jgi:hypothetical protein
MYRKIKIAVVVAATRPMGRLVGPSGSTISTDEGNGRSTSLYGAP